MNNLLWLLIQYIADGYDIANSDEIIYLNKGNMISYRGNYYQKMTTEEVLNEIPKFCNLTGE